MPPKAKFTKEEIVSAALKIVERDGENGLTARALAAELKSSARPVFTVFEDMSSVQREVQTAARAIYESMVEEGLKEDLAFRGVGRAYIAFAARYPKLFQLLFMREAEERPALERVLGTIDGLYGKILQSVKDGYRLPEEQCKRLYTHLWIYSHGIAVLIATKVCAFTDNEISAMLTQVFKSLLNKISTEGSL